MRALVQGLQQPRSRKDTSESPRRKMMTLSEERASWGDSSRSSNWTNTVKNWSQQFAASMNAPRSMKKTRKTSFVHDDDGVMLGQESSFNDRVSMDGGIWGASSDSLAALPPRAKGGKRRSIAFFAQADHSGRQSRAENLGIGGGVGGAGRKYVTTQRLREKKVKEKVCMQRCRTQRRTQRRRSQPV